MLSDKNIFIKINGDDVSTFLTPFSSQHCSDISQIVL